MAAVAALVWGAVGRAADRPVPVDDDEYLIMRRARGVESSGLWASLRESGWGGGPFWRPVPELTWYLEARAGDGLPARMYRDDLVLHMATAAVVGVVARGVTGSAGWGAWAMAAFGVFGSHAEPLAMPACRYDLAATFCAMVAVALFVRALERPGGMALGGSAVALAVAMLCKESTLALPFGLLALAWWWREDGQRARRVRAVAPHVVALALVLGARVAVTGAVGGYYARWPQFEGFKALLAPVSVLAPLGWPVNVDAIRGVAAPARVVVAGAFSAVPCLVALAVRRGVDRRAVGLYALLVAAAVPVYNVISLSHTLDQSRYLYLPAAVYVVLLAVVLKGLEARRFALVLVACQWAVLRVNTEPFAASAAYAGYTLARAAPVADAVRAGHSVRVRGLPGEVPGANLFRDSTFAYALSEIYRVPVARVGTDGTVAPDRAAAFDRVFCWTADGRFVAVDGRRPGAHPEENRKED